MTQIFVSYARADNDTIDRDQRGWVSQLYLALEQELKERGLLDLNLWRDKREIRPYEQFADDIEEGLRQSDLLLSVLSPVYIQKEWCRKELDRFGELLEGDDRAQRERILKVVKREVPLDETPALLQGQEGYRFFEYSGEDRSEIPFYHPGRGAREQYWDVVGRLAEDIASLIRERLGAPGPCAPAARPAAFTVFLAQTTADLIDEVRRLRGELEAAGADVHPREGETLPTSGDALVAEVDALIAKADLSLHLLGATPGFVPDGAEQPVVDIQLERAAAAGRRRVIWCPKLTGERSPRLEGTIRSLRDGRTLNRDDELIEEGFDRFKGYVLPLIARDETEASAAPLPDSDAVLEALAQLSPEQLAELLKAKLQQG